MPHSQLPTTSRPTMILTGRRRRKVESGEICIPPATVAAFRAAHQDNLRNQEIPQRFLLTEEEIWGETYLPITRRLPAA